jgi:predicted Zn-dependent protease
VAVDPKRRLAKLEELTRSGKADSFAWYALALEYANLRRIDEALEAFTRLRRADPGYVPMYLMCGTMLTTAGRHQQGREWLESGIVEARVKGDHHALSELEDALNLIPPPPSIPPPDEP